MSLKSIRESYSKFLTTLSEAGVKLDESQKGNLDSFIIAIESKMNKQKETAIKVTKKVVTEHLESQYKTVFESLMKHMQENSELAAKIQDKVTKINESKKIARKVDQYLNLYVESVLPKKTILDYDRMLKLESLHESLKDLLVVNEDAIEAKKTELTESFTKDKKALETQIAKLQVKLNESMGDNLKLNKKIDQLKAVELLESKTKDLPSYEASQVKRRLAKASTVEIEHNFKKVLESVKDQMKVEEADDELAIEEEVKDIIDCDTPVKENDPIKGRPHLGHVATEAEVDEDDELAKRSHNGNGTHCGHIAEKEDEECEDSECKNEADDVKLDESQKISSAELQLWASIGNKIR